MRSFWQLLRKDILSLRWVVAVLVILSLVWQAYLASKTGNWDGDLIFGLGFLPYIFIPLGLLITSLLVYRNEWKEDTIYLILSLPIKAWQVTVSKLLAVLIGGILGFLAITFGIFILALIQETSFINDYVFQSGVFNYNIGVMLMFILIGLLTGTMLIQLAYIISRMANRLQGLVFIWILVLSSWVIPRLGLLIEPLLRWLPNIRFESYNIVDGQIYTSNIFIPAAPLIAPWLVVIGLFGLATWLWQSHIELA